MGENVPDDVPPDRWQQLPAFFHRLRVIKNSRHPSRAHRLLRASPKTRTRWRGWGWEAARELGGWQGTETGCLAGKQKGCSKHWRWGQPAHLSSSGEALPPWLLANSLQSQPPPPREGTPQCGAAGLGHGSSGLCALRLSCLKIP